MNSVPFSDLFKCRRKSQRHIVRRQEQHEHLGSARATIGYQGQTNALFEGKRKS
jgi:hypothetical protein